MVKEKSKIQLQAEHRSTIAFIYGNECCYRGNMLQSQAFRQGYMIADLLEALKNGIVSFEYRKSDGSIRSALGTTNPNFDPELAAYNKMMEEREDDDLRMPHPKPLLVINYWDCEANGWRSFKAHRLISFNEHESH